jgi:hypothetical protein
MLSDEQLQELTERTYTYDDIRVAFESGFASCQDHMDASDAWDEHRSFLTSTTSWRLRDGERSYRHLPARQGETDDLTEEPT